MKGWGEAKEDEATRSREAAKAAAASEADRRAAIENEPAREKRLRQFLLNDLAAQSTFAFEQMERGLENAADGLANTPAKTESSLGLLDAVAAGAIGGTASLVALKAAKFLLSGMQDSATEEKVLGDAIKDFVKSALSTGMKATAPKSDGDLRVGFVAAQRFKIGEAKSQFVHEFWTQQAETFYFKPLDELERIADAAAVHAQDVDVVSLHQQNTAIAWINFIAQTHHGAFEFDHWADPEHGGHHTDPSGHARKAPEGSDESVGEFERGSVDPERTYDLVNDDGQRPMQKAHHGLLEVHVYKEMRGDAGAQYPHLYLVGHRDYGLRMDGVNAYAKEQLRKCGTVGKAPVNRIIRVYTDLDLNPPKPEFGLLVTADGYVRGESTYGYLDDATKQQVVEYALSRSLEHLD